MTATEQEAARDRYRNLVAEYWDLDQPVNIMTFTLTSLIDFVRWLDESGKLARRRPRGAGENVDPSTPLSTNEGRLLFYLKLDPRGSWKTVREVAAGLYHYDVKPQGKPFNYHIVQLTLSKLVGRGLAEADASKKALRYRARP